MASELLFYHMERARLDDVLPSLLAKSHERGWRSVVRCRTVEVAERLDDRLWTYSDESFLPHSATEDEIDAARQPIWITRGDAMPNAPNVLFVVEGAPLDLTAAAGLDRCVLIFDGGEPAELDHARNLWKGAKAADVDATYWRQGEDGRWAKQNV